MGKQATLHGADSSPSTSPCVSRPCLSSFQHLYSYIASTEIKAKKEGIFGERYSAPADSY